MSANFFLTNRGKKRLLDGFFRNQNVPTNFYVALITSAATPDVDTNTFGELTEIANGNGYTTGGYQLSRNTTDFDVLTEDDTGNLAYVEIKDVSWTASGGTLPGSGSGARWAVLLDDNGTIANREVLAAWSLTEDRVVSSGNPLTIQGLRLTAQETA